MEVDDNPPDDHEAEKGSPLDDLSLPELLYVLLLDENNKLPAYHQLSPCTVISLLLELSLQNTIQLKQKVVWFGLRERRVILLNEKKVATDNSVLQLMISRLEMQKHEHNVQQWTDHWCGKTWAELVLPKHPTEVLRNTITERLIEKNSDETKKKAIEQLEIFLNSKDEEIQVEHLRMALLCLLCGSNFLKYCANGKFKDVGVERLKQITASFPNAWGNLSQDTITVVTEGKEYLTTYQ